MVVDDTNYVRNILKKMINDMNDFEVVEEAVNGLDAIMKFKRTYVDLITMDITMPEMNGLEALKEIMEIDENIKVVMISALGEKDRVLRAISYGAKSYILKPFNKKKVKDVLYEII